SALRVRTATASRRDGLDGEVPRGTPGFLVHQSPVPERGVARQARRTRHAGHRATRRAGRAAVAVRGDLPGCGVGWLLRSRLAVRDAGAPETSAVDGPLARRGPRSPVVGAVGAVVRGGIPGRP